MPAPLGDDWNGVLGAPTIANIDADPELELVVGTVASGIVAYDLPGSTNARVLWGTGRGSFLRTGAIPRNPLRALFSATTPQPIPQPGDTVTLRLTLTNPTGGPLAPLQFKDTLPANLTYAGGLSASRGTASQSGGTITWSGTVPAGTPVTITFQAQISAAISGPTVIANNAQISGGLAMSLRVVLIVKGKGLWLPVVRR